MTNKAQKHHTTQKTKKMSNTDPAKNQGGNPDAREGKQMLRRTCNANTFCRISYVYVQSVSCLSINTTF